MARGGETDDGAEAPVYRADHLPNRWGLRPAKQASLRAAPASGAPEAPRLLPIPFAERIGRTALVVGTFDTKGDELRYIRDRLRAYGVPTRTVDLSTSGKPSRADVTPEPGRSDAPERLRGGLQRRPRRLGRGDGRGLLPLD